MSISEKDILHTAKLAALELSQEEVTQLKAEFDSILQYVAKLSHLKVGGVNPMSHVHGAANEFREDLAQDTFALEELKALAPDFSHGGFRVHKVL